MRAEQELSSIQNFSSATCTPQNPSLKAILSVLARRGMADRLVAVAPLEGPEPAVAAVRVAKISVPLVIVLVGSGQVT